MDIRIINRFVLPLIALSLTGCDLLKGVFEAGLITGIILVILVIALIIFLIVKVIKWIRG